MPHIMYLLTQHADAEAMFRCSKSKTLRSLLGRPEASVRLHIFISMLLFLVSMHSRIFVIFEIFMVFMLSLMCAQVVL